MAPRARTHQARRLRADQTDAERKLWYALRDLKLPFNVRRQHPLGPYIADFAIPARHLAIEIDGGQHADAMEADRRRTDELGKRGYRVLRFWNNDVHGNFLQTITAALEMPPPLPNPLRPRGRRGS